MKSLIKAVAIAAVLAAPVASFAQSNQPVTRAEVRAQLVQLEKAGYNPSQNDLYYPANVQAAQARVAPVNTVEQSGFGSSTNGNSQSGFRHDSTASSYSPPVYNAH
ncbi:DUF4148 domain-containing protein [Paraburkholderia sp.]|uniref:DUF4148 domain-containing protein n=1 Tax=Paraburkholderia sp. TaxID=1926495 RepID=UPI002391AC07|nr:DUF4148 domain-containing protein [Paraburkholderia sp.]MDE1181786.1 DUF4148 domain-containing protein [Paraburkholderia sp.]